LSAAWPDETLFSDGALRPDVMIFIDAREGVSGDMLLAAMLGLLEPEQRDSAHERLALACRERMSEFHLVELEDGGEKGLGITYLDRSERDHGLSYVEATEALSEIDRELGSSGPLSAHILALLFDAESKAHGLPKEEVHLHELGRTGALMNIAGIGLTASQLLRSAKDAIVCSTITTGKGTVVISHGPSNVPAPAARHLLDGLRHVQGTHPGERATPTGIAALRALVSSQSDDLPVSPSARSVGFGTKRFGGRLGRVVLHRV
jgi:uncharacterized protein (DUF111 family)